MNKRAKRYDDGLRARAAPGRATGHTHTHTHAHTHTHDKNNTTNDHTNGSTPQALHSSLVLTVVQRHGVTAAMRLIGTTLTWLSTLPADGGVSADLPTSPRSRFTESTQNVGERWRSAVRRALATPDPWASRPPIPLYRAKRLQLVGSTWVEDELLVRCEREPFTRGAMRHCHRIRVLMGPGRRPLNLVAKT